jgi:hypothetical protein
MITNAYSLYDCKALTYSPPFFANAHGQAVRLVMDLAQDANTTVGRHPVDFTLFCIGQYNDALGVLLPNDVREHIADVASLLPRPAAVGDLFNPAQ